MSSGRVSVSTVSLMQGGAVVPTPGQSPREIFQAVFDQLLASNAAAGIETASAVTTMAVTGRSDEDVKLIQELAQANGFRNAVFVDDAPTPRPGTVHSSTLSSMQSATLAEARAHRILAD